MALRDIIFESIKKFVLKEADPKSNDIVQKRIQRQKNDFPILTKYKNRYGETEFDQLVNIDPTPDKRFLYQICKWKSRDISLQDSEIKKYIDQYYKHIVGLDSSPNPSFKELEDYLYQFYNYILNNSEYSLYFKTELWDEIQDLLHKKNSTALKLYNEFRTFLVYDENQLTAEDLKNYAKFIMYCNTDDFMIMKREKEYYPNLDFEFPSNAYSMQAGPKAVLFDKKLGLEINEDINKGLNSLETWNTFVNVVGGQLKKQYDKAIADDEAEKIEAEKAKAEGKKVEYEPGRHEKQLTMYFSFYHMQLTPPFTYKAFLDDFVFRLNTNVNPWNRNWQGFKLFVNKDRKDFDISNFKTFDDLKQYVWRLS